MASQLSIGDTVRFTNPEDKQPDVGKLLGWEGGDLKVQTRDGIVYVYPGDVKIGGNSRKNGSSRKSSSRSRKSSSRTNKVVGRKTRSNRKVGGNNYYAEMAKFVNGPCSKGGKHDWVGMRDMRCTKCGAQVSDR